MQQPLHVISISLLLIMSLIQAVAQTPLSVSGRVTGYLTNRIGDYDGLRLQTSVGEVRLFFPPHTAARIRLLAATGQRVKADVGARPPGPIRPVPDKTGQEAAADRSVPVTYQLVRLRNAASGSTFQLSDLPPPLPKSGNPVQTEGPLMEKLHDEQGQLTALLTDKYLIELKPHQAEQISSLLVGVQRLGISGFERNLDGFVNRTGRPVLHPTSLTIRGQLFAL